MPEGGVSIEEGRPRLFLNTHPSEVAAPELVPSLQEIRNIRKGLPDLIAMIGRPVSNLGATGHR